MKKLAKGFTDENGKFRPTGGKGTSSREKSIETEGVSMQELGKGTVALNVDDPLAETKTKRRKQAMILKFLFFPVLTFLPTNLSHLPY